MRPIIATILSVEEAVGRVAAAMITPLLRISFPTRGTSAASLFINISAMGNASDAHCPVVIIDHIHDTVIADVGTPEILVTMQLLAAGRSWIDGQTFDPRDQAREELITQVLQLLLRRRLDIESVFSHASARA